METLIKFLYLLICTPVVFLLAKPLYRSRSARVMIITIHALLMVALTVFVFNSPGWRWSEQKEFLHLVPHNEEAAYRHINENFILLDNSYDKALVPYEEGDDDSTVVTITSRKTLASLFQFFNQHLNDIDLVVYDIGLTTQTADDDRLNREMQYLADKDKLILSGEKTASANPFFKFPGSIYGNIREQGNEHLFVSHTIQKEGGFSLAYKLYHKLDTVTTEEPFFFGSLFWEEKGGRSYLSTNLFFPEFSFTDENKMRGIQTPVTDPASISTDSGYEKDHLSYYYLSTPLSKEGKQAFANDLAVRKKKGYRNVLFIGTFGSADEDIHQTLYGPMHGPTILLNIYYALEKGNHHMEVSFLLLLFTGFFLVTYTLVHACLKTPPVLFSWLGIGRKRSGNREHEHNLFVKILLACLEFLFVEELHFILLILLVLFIRWWSGHMINGFSLLIYLGIINLSLQFAREKILHEHPADYGG